MRIVTLAAMVALGGVISGCSTTGEKSAVPSLAFGAFRGFGEPSGKLEGASLVSALNGGVIDPGVASGMDSGIRNKALQAEYEALEYTPAGQKVTWGKPGDRFSGEVSPSQPYRVGSQDCRQYSHVVYSGGTAATGRGTACRNADGSWTPLT